MSQMGAILAVVVGCAIGIADITVDSAHQPASAATLWTPEKGTHDGGASSAKLCGRNGLYMFFRLLGYDASFSEIEQHVPVGPEGSSLLELCNTAEKFGVPLAVYKCEPSWREAAHLPPCMALMRVQLPRGGGKKTIPQGHYVLVERARRAGAQVQIDMIDGLYGFRETLSGEEFAAIWTGYYLAPLHSRWEPWLRWAAIAGVISLLGFSLWRFCCRWAGPSGNQTRHNVPAIFIASMVAALAMSGYWNGVFGDEIAPRVHNKYDSRDGSWKAWRTPERDAVNALYFVLRHCDIRCTYQDVHKAFGGDERKRNLLEIRDAARALGMNTSIYRCTPASLGSLKVPVIAHFEGIGANTGGFSVVLPTRNRAGLWVIDGDTAQLINVKEDELRRAWNGFMLAPEAESLWNYWVLSACMLVLIIVVRIWVGHFAQPFLKKASSLEGSVPDGFSV